MHGAHRATRGPITALAPAAVCAWATALATLRLDSLPAALAVASVLLAAAGVAAWMWQRRGVSYAVVGAAAAVIGAVVAASAAIHLSARDASPWPLWAQQRTRVTAMVEVTSPGRLSSASTPWQGSSTREFARARTVTVDADGRSWRTGAAVAVVFDHGDRPSTVAPGDRLTGTFRVSAAQQPESGASATLTAVGDITVRPRDGPAAAVLTRFDAVGAASPRAVAALVSGMVFGDDSDLPTLTRDQIQASGLSHLTAVSGANIAIVVGVVLLGARWLGVPKPWALAGALGALAIYVSMVGTEPSVLRASVMALVTLAGVLIGGGEGMAALATAIVVLLVAEPWLAYSRGFALSCAATAALVAAAKPGLTIVALVTQASPRGLRTVAGATAAAVLTAVAAGAATAPLLAAYGQGVSVVTVVANVAAAPAVPLVTVSGLVVAAVAMLSPSAAVIGMEIPAWGATWILAVAQWAASVPGGRMPWPQGTVGGMAMVLAVAVILIAGRRWRWLPVVVPASAALVSIVSAAAPSSLVRMPAGWTMVFCDVGQGDAVLLRAGPDAAVLVDAGPHESSAVDCVRRSGVRHVPMVVLSHFHADHVAGVEQIFAAYRPQQVLVSPLREPPETYRAVQEALVASGVPTASPQPGERYTAGWVSMTIIGPSRIPREGSPPNNASLSLIAAVATDTDTRPSTAFLSGDLEPLGQSALMSSAAAVDVDVAKVPHHGSAKQHPQLPAWTGAEVAVISCGRDNDYGHPASDTITLWQAAGAQVARTDTLGDVIVVSERDRRPAIVTRPVADRAD